MLELRIDAFAGPIERELTDCRVLQPAPGPIVTPSLVRVLTYKPNFVTVLQRVQAGSLDRL